ncbi:MAG: hypothetical protein KAI33_08590, partial [Elusimicrobiales bacterium]|nr:hypothetical protein [Elusimicrobiales bacterium]
MMNKIKILSFGVLMTLLSCEVFASNKSAYLHFLNGLILERKGNYSDALNEYRKTIVLDSEALFAYKQAVNVSILLNKFEEANGWVEYIVKVDSAVSSNWVLYGNVQWARGKIEPAKKAFKKAVKMDKANNEGLYQLAVIYSSDDSKTSLDYFEKYL